MNLTGLNSTPRHEFLILNAYPKCYQASSNYHKMNTNHCVLQYLQSSESQQAYYGNAKYEQRMGPHLKRPSKASRNVTDQIQQMEL